MIFESNELAAVWRAIVMWQHVTDRLRLWKYLHAQGIMLVFWDEGDVA